MNAIVDDIQTEDGFRKYSPIHNYISEDFFERQFFKSKSQFLAMVHLFKETEKNSSLN